MSDTPTDILSLIFELAIAIRPSSLYTIRSVNRNWFQTAAITPKLWSNLILSHKIHFIDVEYVRVHLQNAGGLPLDISISLPEDLQDADIPVIPLLRERVHKFKSLIMEMPSLEAWKKIVSGIGEGQAAPILERFVFKVKEDEWEESFHLPYTTLANAFTPSPNLVYLQLPAWPLPAQPSPHFSTIVSLVLLTDHYLIKIADVFPLILAANRLQHFTFRVNGEYGESSDPDYTNVISVPHRQSMDVTYPGYGLNLLGNFRAPNLVNVRLDGFRPCIPEKDGWELEDWGFEFTLPSAAILNILAAHSPNIRRLELNYIQSAHPNEDYFRIFSGQIFPVLEELVLGRTNLQDTVLIQSAGSHHSLKKLELGECKYVTIVGLRSFVEGHVSSDFLLILRACPAIHLEDSELLSSLVYLKYTPA